mmetsp:Transcript_55122/g.171227  ORF Transcript_55122/g.171227 Transcript_55122/m.171227 type:complete len:262 (+) Transcript_55122:644-1429(+)
MQRFCAASQLCRSPCSMASNCAVARRNLRPPGPVGPSVDTPHPSGGRQGRPSGSRSPTPGATVGSRGEGMDIPCGDLGVAFTSEPSRPFTARWHRSWWHSRIMPRNFRHIIRWCLSVWAAVATVRRNCFSCWRLLPEPLAGVLQAGSSPAPAVAAPLSPAAAVGDSGDAGEESSTAPGPWPPAAASAAASAVFSPADRGNTLLVLGDGCAGGWTAASRGIGCGEGSCPKSWMLPVRSLTPLTKSTGTRSMLKASTDPPAPP